MDCIIKEKSIPLAKANQAKCLRRKGKSNTANRALSYKSQLHFYQEYGSLVWATWLPFPLLAKSKENSEMECHRQAMKMIRGIEGVLEEASMKRLGLFRLAGRQKRHIKITNGTEKLDQVRSLI